MGTLERKDLIPELLLLLQRTTTTIRLAM